MLSRLTGVGWKQVLCVLRPDCLLVYFTTDPKAAQRPDELFPLSEIEIKTAQLSSTPTGASAFWLKLQGGSRTTFAAPGGDVARMRWVDAIETSECSLFSSNCHNVYS